MLRFAPLWTKPTARAVSAVSMRTMVVATTVAQCRAACAPHAQTGGLGFVPTMGSLHEGHLHLVREAKKANQKVAVSIFVNPTQFGPKEDFATYPRDTERDLKMLKSVNADVVFLPSAEEMYPEGFGPKSRGGTFVDVTSLAALLEGGPRPHFFRGVCTVVSKLFNIVQPQRAYFGAKDAQQVAVIQAMVKHLHMPIDVVRVPTVRETDGLAMSSRNMYLSPAERNIAPVFHRALQAGASLYEGSRVTESARVLKAVHETLATEKSVTVQYISLADPLTLLEIDRIGPNGALLSGAIILGKTRLIDNLLLPPLKA